MTSPSGALSPSRKASILEGAHVHRGAPEVLDVFFVVTTVSRQCELCVFSAFEALNNTSPIGFGLVWFGSECASRGRPT